MANRFPLVLDTTDGNKIKELPATDNLDLRENSIVNVQNINSLGTINAPNITVNGQKLVAQNFRDLADTPSTFIGSENYFVKVNETGSGIEFRPLSEIGTISVAGITSTENIVPNTSGIGQVGTIDKKYHRVVSEELVGDLVSYGGSTVFDATTGKISYAALQGAPGFLSEFQDDIGFLRAADLNTEIAGLFDEGVPFQSDIKGSVFADDSTVLVDGTSGVIVGPVATTTVEAGQITGSVQVTAPIVNLEFLEGTNGSNLKIEATENYDVVIGQENTGNVKIYNAQAENFTAGIDLGIGEIIGATDLILGAANRIKLVNGIPFTFSSVAQSDLNQTVPANGDFIYNTTTNRFQMYQNGVWDDVNGNVQATTGTSNLNNLIVAGDLTVQGTTTSVETTNTTITDNVITLNNGEVGAGVTATTSGIEIDRGSESNVSLVWDDSVDKWTVGSQTLAADAFESVAVRTALIDTAVPGPLQIKAGDVADTGNVIFINPYGSGTFITMQAENYVLKTGPYLSNTDPFIDFTTSGSFKTYQGAFFEGNLTGDITGSVFADDSSPMVDAVGNSMTANSATFTTTTSPTIIGTNINPVTGQTIVVGGSAGSFNYNDATGAIQVASTGPVSIEGAASAAVNIGTGTSGAVTLGSGTNNIVVAAGTSVDLSNVNVQNAAFDLVGNVDNTALALGDTATTVTIGNSSSSTTISGNLQLNSALIVNNITADDSISILTGGNTANEAISLGPQGTNTAINLTATNLRFNGNVTTTINATGGIVGDLQGSIYADDSSVMIDGVNAQVVGNVSSNLVRTPEIKNLSSGTDIDIEAQGFLELFGGAANAGLSKIQLDTAGINYIELQTTPNTPADPNDTATILVNGQTDSGDVIIGNSATTRNQTVEIYNATVTGDVIGTVTGTVYGVVQGDVNGSIYADDSTLLIDGINGKIVGPFEGSISKLVGDVQQIVGPGVISLDTLHTELTTTGNPDAFTLANGTLGQIKIITRVGGVAGDANITPATFANGSSITMGDTADSVTLIYTTIGWVVTAAQSITVNP